MKKIIMGAVIGLLVVSNVALASALERWIMDSQADWEQGTALQSNIEIKGGMVSPTASTATFQSALKSFI